MERKRRRRDEIIYRRVGTDGGWGRRRGGFARGLGIALLLLLLMVAAAIGGALFYRHFLEGKDITLIPERWGQNAEREEEPEEMFVSEQLRQGTIQGARAGIADPMEERLKELEEARHRYATNPDRPKVKGIYVTGPMAGSSSLEQLIDLVDTTELNAMVIDVKNDAGEITFRPEQSSDLIREASVRYISDIQEVMTRLKDHGIYTIARIVCFKDQFLAENAPELALLKENGDYVTDGSDVAWVNPYSQKVWDYLLEVARMAAQAGFDEVQFDYVRFPLGADSGTARYGVDTESYTKQEAIRDFLKYMTENLKEDGVPVTADVFGTIIGNSVDVANVGQDYTALGETVAALCPMVYPSHYAAGVFGLEVPDAQPYETIYAAMMDSQEDLGEVSREQCAVVRPWLQAFTATWVKGHITYGGEQIRAQIQAVYDAGYEEWLLWNSSNRYSKYGLLSEDGVLQLEEEGQ